MNTTKYIANITSAHGIKLKPVDRALITTFISLGAALPDGVAVANDELAELIGMNPRTVMRSKQKLVDAGVLTQINQKNLPSHYYLNTKPLGSHRKDATVTVEPPAKKCYGMVERIVERQTEAKKANQLREETVTLITLMKDKVDAEALIQMIEVLEHSRKPVVVGVEVKESIKNEVGARVEYTFKKQPIDHDAMRQYALRRLAIVNVEYISVLANRHVNGQQVKALREDAREVFTELMHKMVADGELVYTDQRKKKVTLP